MNFENDHFLEHGSISLKEGEGGGVNEIIHELYIMDGSNTNSLRWKKVSTYVRCESNPFMLEYTLVTYPPGCHPVSLRGNFEKWPSTRPN
jgi:hypothetical protein